MRKFTTTIAMMMAMALSLFAQIPQTMSYQAVVRDAENAIVASQSVSIELSILQGSDEGTAVYTETHNATTNANGLITLELGAGESSDNFSAIDWSAGPYFVKTVAEIDGKQVSGVSPMLVVPYAKYAETAGNVPDMSEYAKKSDIPADVDLSNYATKSELPSLEGYAKTEDIPSLDGYAKTEDLPNMSEYTKTADLPTVDLSGYAKTSEIADMATKTYVDGKVAAVEVPTTVAELTDAADYAKTSDVSSAIATATTDMVTKTYVDGKVAAVEVPTKVSDLTDAGDYAKTSEVSSAIATATTDMATKTYVDDKVAAVEVPTTVAELTDATDYANVQADWSETDATKDSYIKNKPTLATVATSGSYEDLSNKPTIPDVTGFATKSELDDYAKTEDLPNMSEYTKTADLPTVDLSVYYSKAQVDSLFAAMESKINGYVDLGLSVKWATCNIGAVTPEDYGSYYAWGETTIKSDYNGETYNYSDKYGALLTKYCTISGHGTVVDNKTTLERIDDVAYIILGGKWRMPTEAEWTELREKCTWTWTQKNGVNGYEVKASNGNSIFLPAAGIFIDNRAGYYEIEGNYWSSSLNEGSPHRALVVHIESSFVKGGDMSRDYGLSVRPVYSY